MQDSRARERAARASRSESVSSALMSVFQSSSSSAPASTRSPSLTGKLAIWPPSAGDKPARRQAATGPRSAVTRVTATGSGREKYQAAASTAPTSAATKAMRFIATSSGESAGSLTDCGGQRLPGPGVAGIEMHKIRFGVVTDAAGFQCQSGIAELGGLGARQAHVDRAAFDVQAVLGHAGRHVTQNFVRVRRAIPRDDLEIAARVERRKERVQLVEQRDVDLVNLLGSEIAQVMIDLDERVGNDLAVLAIRDRELLGRMNVIERQTVRRDVFGRGPPGNAGERRGRAERSHQEAA